MSEEDGRAILRRTMDQYLKDREKFAVGFVRFVLERGLQTKAPLRDGKPVETWRDVGQRLYGRELFEATLAAEVQARRQADAESRLSTVRGDQRKDAQAGQAAGGSQDERSQDHERSRRRGSPEPS